MGRDGRVHSFEPKKSPQDFQPVHINDAVGYINK